MRLFPLLGLYPWECGFCREERLYRSRYTRVRVKKTPSAKPENRPAILAQPDAERVRV
jgi:hypothetical protein